MPGRAVQTWEWRVRGASGKIALLRVQEKGQGYGPKKDYIDAEVIIQLNTMPNHSFGFELRHDESLASRQGMLDLLIDAHRHDSTVGIAYYHRYVFSTKKYDDKKNHRLLRVWLK